MSQMPAAAPAGPGGPDADATYKGAQADAANQITSEQPEPTEPIKLSSLGALHTGIAAVADSLGNGQLPVPPPPEPGMEQAGVPPELYVPAAAIGAAFTSLGDQFPPMKKYAFDATQLASTNAGIADMGTRMSAAAKDKELKRALTQGPGEPEGDEAPAPAGPALSDDDLDQM